MPYSAEHKQQSRNRILASAFELFAHQGFNKVTIDAVTQHAGLTRGAFYSHFSSKQVLYREAMQYAALNSKLMKVANQEGAGIDTLITLIEGYLSRGHLYHEQPCPMGFLVTDMANQELDVRATYTRIFNGLTQRIAKLMTGDLNTAQPNPQAQALAALLIGGIAVSRALSDDDLMNQVMSACRALAINTARASVQVQELGELMPG